MVEANLPVLFFKDVIVFPFSELRIEFNSNTEKMILENSEKNNDNHLLLCNLKDSLEESLNIKATKANKNEKVMKITRDEVIGHEFKDVWPKAEARWSRVILECLRQKRTTHCIGESADAESYLEAIAFPIPPDMAAVIFLVELVYSASLAVPCACFGTLRP